MDQAKARKVRRLVIGLGVGLLALMAVGLLAIIVVGSFFRAMREQSKQVYATQDYLQRPEVAKAVASKMARYCQSLGKSKELTAEEVGALVSELSGTNEVSYGSATTNMATLEMGGGFLHYGYTLSLDVDASNDATNMWILTFYSEGKPSKTLLLLPTFATNVPVERTTNATILPK